MSLKKNILALRQKKAIVEKGGGDKAIEALDLFWPNNVFNRADGR